MMLDLAGHGYALALAVLVAAVYLLIIRFLDMNEKEPWWSVGLLFALGGLAALVVNLLFSSTMLELRPVESAVVEELALFVAIAAGFWTLTAISKLRGWSEISGLMDGVVYGASAGLGFATGAAFINELSATGMVMPVGGAGLWSLFWTTALIGLANGVFGALIGAGFGAASYTRSESKRLIYPIVGLLLAFAADVGYRKLAYGNALGGQSGLMRMWVALLLPVAMVVLLAFYALWREKVAIRRQLEDERGQGTVTIEELEALKSVTARQRIYFTALGSMNWTRWASLRQLHNRQVMLALAKQRAANETDATRRAMIQQEVQSIRLSIAQIRQTTARGMNGGVQ
ncbi:MAG: PrsW family intramembrane metalloprotease [Phycisphaerales bacterium]|nr:PrsW family intramembrane metalloprotease [Phycisphaerales bacterium]